MTSTTSIVVDGVVRSPPTGIKVIIVGAGLAGLCMGIESWRKGHDVEIIERSTSIVPTDWTMESELEKEKAGIFVQDLETNGEWTLA
ncbi:unnamed protein product [Clonostachys rhizophaga]|uniref:FAD-dependent oxidoreductase 2 FAD-binding domain-containing protein n=1 Tax=Clonostachys rhizophaga TaxID=160324 RepID=A0A9N9YFB8_9HYPO|nr:unnamed protein product [Clonostachys rhizophaga]